jgi:hypothetical protein
VLFVAAIISRFVHHQRKSTEEREETLLNCYSILPSSISSIDQPEASESVKREEEEKDELPVLADTDKKHH